MTATSPAIQIPAFRKSLRVDHVAGEGTYFFSEAGRLILIGGTIEAVVTLIDGKRSADDIAASLEDRIRAEDVYYTLSMMEQNRLIYDAAAQDNDADLLLWNYLGADLRRAEEGLRNLHVKAVVTPELSETPIVDALRSFGLQIRERGDFTVVFTSDYLDPALAEVNREAIDRRAPWMLVKPSGVVQLFGPIFSPGKTACWECLAYRLRSRRALESYLELYGRSSPVARVHAPSGLDALSVRLAAFHVAKWIALSDNEQLGGRIVSLDVSTLATAAHAVTRRPQCPCCGDEKGARIFPSPPALDNRPKVMSVESGQRGSLSEDVFARYQHHVSPITGVVSSLVPLRESSDDLVKLCVASHNFAVDGNSLAMLRTSSQVQSCGKGITRAQAEAGALLEALERYSGVFAGDEARISASYRSLNGEAVHPNSCLLFSERQYANRDEWNKLGSAFSLIPLPFDENVEMEWSPVWSLTERRFKYLPAAYLYYGYKQDPATAMCWADSNGNAAGSSLEEAISHGFYELAERDAVALWWYNRLGMPAVDIESFGDPYLNRTLEYYRQRGREVWVLDVTNDFELPVFAAISRRIGQPLEEITLGFGAHPDAHVALLRAVSEMNQFLPAVDGPMGSDGKRQYAYSDVSAIRWWETASVANQPYLLPNPAFDRRRKDSYPAADSDDQLVDVMNCVLRARDMGLETLLLDQTRPDIGVHVAKVIVPGIRHFWARLAPGRLYEAPVKLGRLKRRLREEELNPVPMFV